MPLLAVPISRTHQSCRRPRRQAGFTLIELMITVVVISILAAIAYTNYSEYVTRSRRAAATTCLMEAAQFLERYYTTQLTYVGAGAAPQCDPETAPFYTVSYVGNVAPAAKTFNLQAVPQGVQATRDTLCGTLTLDAQGVRGESGTAGAAVECW